MSDRRTTLTDRIAFAEGWLDRARQQIEEGQEAHGALTLLLAEAELHRAREAGTSPALVPLIGRKRPRPWHSWAALGLAAAIAGLVAVTHVMMRAQHCQGYRGDDEDHTGAQRHMGLKQPIPPPAESDRLWQ